VGPGAVLFQPRPTITLRGIRQERKSPQCHHKTVNNSEREVTENDNDDDVNDVVNDSTRRV